MKKLPSGWLLAITDWGKLGHNVWFSKSWSRTWWAIMASTVLASLGGAGGPDCKDWKSVHQTCLYPLWWLFKFNLKMINFHFKPVQVHFGDHSQYCPQDSHMDCAQTVKVMITHYSLVDRIQTKLKCHLSGGTLLPWQHFILVHCCCLVRKLNNEHCIIYIWYTLYIRDNVFCIHASEFQQLIRNYVGK